MTGFEVQDPKTKQPPVAIPAATPISCSSSCSADRRAGEILGDLLKELAGPDGRTAGSLSDAFASALQRDPGLLAYIQRSLIDGGPAAAGLFRRLFDVTEAGLAGLTELGVIRPAPDTPLRAAVLLANDLAAILLRDAIATVLGLDPLSREGLARWGAEVLDLYTRGLFASGSPAGAEPAGAAPARETPQS